MRALLTALTLVFILARVPAGDNVQEVADALRDAARKAGCPTPRVAMRSIGDGRMISIEVTCADKQATRP